MGPILNEQSINAKYWVSKIKYFVNCYQCRRWLVGAPRRDLIIWGSPLCISEITHKYVRVLPSARRTEFSPK
jgi:hypothetical protein